MQFDRVVRGAVCWMVLAPCVATVSWADEPARQTPESVLLSVPVPLTGNRDILVRGAILRQIDRLQGGQQRGVLVLRFDDAQGDDAAGSDFGRALELARFLTSSRLAGVKTVAWLPDGARGHAVLVALACDMIAMPPGAELGPANVREPVVDDAMRAAYREIAARRRTVPPTVAVAMIDPSARVLKVSTDAGAEFVPEGDLEAVKERVAVVASERLDPAPLAFTGRRAREFGFVGLLASSVGELARGLGLDEKALVIDPSFDGGWRGVQVSLSGVIGADAVTRVRNRIDRAVSDNANCVCLKIDSAGGAPEQSLVLANWLAGLDPAKVRTIAWIPSEARGDAALVALACDEVVMRPGAVLGGDGSATMDERRAEAIAVAWRAGVAKLRDRTWSLPLATVLPGILVQRAEQQGTGRVEFFSAEELAARKDRDEWMLGAELGASPLAVNGRRAEELGLATHVVDDFPGLRRVYGLDDDMGIIEPGWADELLAALASPSLAWVLLLIGGAGLYVELKTPGVGFGGFVAMVAFIVYFWSQYLNGTAGWLEVMLFLAGVVCVLAEIFVLPGFGVLGLGGGLLVIASLVLASQSFVLPVNAYQLRQMQWSLAGILAAFVGVAVVASIVKQWLPSTPGLRAVLLEPPPEDVFRDDEFEMLVGAEGVTTTRLVMAGKARIVGEVRDVVSDGMLIEPGVPVRVVEVRGGRLIVRPVTHA